MPQPAGDDRHADGDDDERREGTEQPPATRVRERQADGDREHGDVAAPREAQHHAHAGNGDKERGEPPLQIGRAVEQHGAGDGDERHQEERDGVGGLVDRDRRVLRRVEATDPQRVDDDGDVEQGGHDATSAESGHQQEGLPAAADHVH